MAMAADLQTTWKFAGSVLKPLWVSRISSLGTVGGGRGAAVGVTMFSGSDWGGFDNLVCLTGVCFPVMGRAEAGIFR